jgi:hypothetical protein
MAKMDILLLVDLLLDIQVFQLHQEILLAGAVVETVLL